MHRQKDDRNVGKPADFLRTLEPVHSRHHDVHEDEIRPDGFFDRENLKRLKAVGRRHRIKPEIFEIAGNKTPDFRLIVHNHDGRLFLHFASPKIHWFLIPGWKP